MRITYEFHKDDPPERCPGGRFINPRGGFIAKKLKSLYACRDSINTIQEAASWKQDRIYGAYARRPNRLLFLSTQCARCALNIDVTVEVDGRRPTGNIRVDYSDSLKPGSDLERPLKNPVNQ